jgi:hypothetical protein
VLKTQIPSQISESRLEQLLKKIEFNNNYTIKYKNIFDDDNTILKNDLLLSRFYCLLQLKDQRDVRPFTD